MSSTKEKADGGNTRESVAAAGKELTKKASSKSASTEAVASGVTSHAWLERDAHGPWPEASPWQGMLTATLTQRAAQSETTKTAPVRAKPASFERRQEVFTPSF